LRCIPLVNLPLQAQYSKMKCNLLHFNKLFLRPGDVHLQLQLADLYRRGGQLEKARFHQDTAYMLQRYPEQASHGISVLNNAVSAITLLTDQPDGSTSHRHQDP
jgi:hypothetical protein